MQSKFDPTADTGEDNTIDVPQNVNFAVSANLLRSFLDAQDVDYESEPSTTMLTASEVAARAQGVHGLAGVLAVGRRRPGRASAVEGEAG